MAKTSPKNLIRALRLPFIAASVLPFICGALASLIKKEPVISSVPTIAIQTLVGIIFTIGAIL